MSQQGTIAALTTFSAPGFVAELASESGADVDQVHDADLLDELLDGLPSLNEAVETLVCWPRLEELWLGLPEPGASLADGRAVDGRGADGYRDAALEFAEAALDAARLRNCALVFVLPALPAERPLGIGDADTVSGVVATATAVREALRARLAGQRDTHLVDADEDVRLLGAERSWDGDRGYHAELQRAVALRSARMIDLLRSPRPRVVVVEVDGVLWPGRLAELGAEKVEPSVAARRLPRLRAMGVAVAICADAPAEELEAVLDRPDSGVRRHHVAALRAAPLTGELLADLADEFGVRRDEVVVLRADDDGPAGWTVQVVQLSGTQLPDLLPPGRAVLPLGPTEMRDERVTAGLGIRVRFPDQAPDGAGLESLRTAGHAFEINDWQAGPAEFAVLAADPEHLVLVAELADVDGEHGPVGIAVLRFTGNDAQLLAFRVSTRAAGRSVEQALLAELLDRAARRGVESVSAAVRDLGRNAPALQFFAGLGIGAGARSEPLPPYAWPAGVVREEASDG